jgi:hypothetical protein
VKRFISAGTLIVAKKTMGGYRFDPRTKIPTDTKDFCRIESGTCAMFLDSIPNQFTSVAVVSDWGGADLFLFLFGKDLIWQAWYHDRRRFDGEFFDAWEIVKC